MFKELFLEASSSSEYDNIQRLWKKLQNSEKILDACYDDSGNLLVVGNQLGGKKGACTRGTSKLYKEIDKVFGASKTGTKALEVYTALQNGTDISKIEKVK